MRTSTGVWRTSRPRPGWGETAVLVVSLLAPVPASAAPPRLLRVEGGRPAFAVVTVPGGEGVVPDPDTAMTRALAGVLAVHDPDDITDLARAIGASSAPRARLVISEHLS